MSAGTALLCIAIAAAGSAVQASTGLGFGLLSSPILAIVDTDFVPGAVIIAILPLSAAVAIECIADVDRRGAALALIGRVPGVIAGAALAASISQRSLAIGLAVAVLVAVALSFRLPRFRVRPGVLVAAGAVSGFMGTATGVGGPPMALVYQRSDARTVRATLAVFFGLGSLLSLAALAIAGDLHARQFRLELLLVPGVIVGIVSSRWMRRWVDGPRFRPALLTICAVSAVVLLAKQLA